jgi:cytidylate kinase
MAVINIRHEYATGGRELGQLIANRAGYRFVDKYLFQKIMDDLSVSGGTLESFEKSRHYYITNLFLRLISKKYIKRIVGHDKSVVCEVEYKDALKNIIAEIAAKDNVVILGRASCYFLKDMENCYNIRIIAPMEWRERYAVDKLKIPADDVKKVIEERDENQRWFFKTIWGEDFNERHLYHVILNMSLDSFERATQIVLAAAGLPGSKSPDSKGATKPSYAVTNPRISA